MLCLVDDAHRADAAWLDVLAFAARRLDAEPVAPAVAMRADEGRPLDVSGLVDVPLAGLDHPTALAQLAEHGLPRRRPQGRKPARGVQQAAISPGEYREA